MSGATAISLSSSTSHDACGASGSAIDETEPATFAKQLPASARHFLGNPTFYFPVRVWCLCQWKWCLSASEWVCIVKRYYVVQTSDLGKMASKSCSDYAIIADARDQQKKNIIKSIWIFRLWNLDYMVRLRRSQFLQNFVLFWICAVVLLALFTNLNVAGKVSARWK